MIKGFKAITFVLIGALAGGLALAAFGASPTPKQDQEAFQNYFKSRFPDIKPADYVNGSVVFDESLKAQWKDIMQFPPYSFAVSTGEDLFKQPLADGKHYADCFANGGIGVRQNYPKFDQKTGKVVTLVSAIQACRVKHGNKPLPPYKGDIAALTAYMASTSDGKPMDIKVPDDPGALAAYENGKRVFYQRRGQLNFSCASCHVQATGRHLRRQAISAAYGMVNSFPIYRSSWGEMGTFDRRLKGCFENVRAKPLKPQGKAYRDLEYFLSYMSNGLPIAGPGARP